LWHCILFQESLHSFFLNLQRMLFSWSYSAFVIHIFLHPFPRKWKNPHLKCDLLFYHLDYYCN
jgi:hypothetical protein